MERELLVKCRADTDPSFGVKPRDREINDYISKGVINLDKTRGPTSHQVASWVSRILDVSKVGHGGTLDPGVSGVLPVAIGKATRLAQVFLPAGKEYVCLMELHGDLPYLKMKKALSYFVGEIKQKPPVRSAVKRVERKRKVYGIETLEVKKREVLFTVSCEAGTYIRKLCHDFGVFVKVGAHMSELRRTRAGPFKEQDSVKLQDLADAYAIWKERNDESYLRRCIMPMEDAVQHIPKIVVKDGAVDALCHGSPLMAPGVVMLESDIRKEGMVAVISLKGELVGIGAARLDSREILDVKRGVVCELSKVFMDIETYPKIWGKDG